MFFFIFEYSNVKLLIFTIIILTFELQANVRVNSFVASNDGFARYLHQSSYYENDGFTLKYDQEIAVQLAAKRPRDYFLQVPMDGASFCLVVTPCGGMVKWKLAHQQQFSLSADDEFWVDDVGEWFVGNRSMETIAPEINHKHYQQNRMWSSRARQHKLADYHKISLPVMETMLVKEVGNQAMEYSRENMPAGTFHLYLLAAENDTLTARIYASLTPKAGVDNTWTENRFFPKLPKRKRVQLHNISKTSVAVVWDHSPSVSLHKQSDIEYCLVLSSRRHYATKCDYEQEKSKRLRIQRQNQRKANAIKRRTGVAAPIFEGRTGTGKSGDDDVTYACTRFKTEYFFDRLKANTKYYLSLFALNLRTAGSVAYDGASFVTRTEGLYSNKAVRMVDGQMYASYLNPTKSSFRLYDVIVEKYRRQLIIMVQPCTGYLRVHIYKDGHVLRKSVFEDLKSFVVTNLQPGILRIKVINDDNESKLFKIWYSRRSSKNPYPKLPVDPSLKTSEMGRTCRSVELVWLTAPGRGPHDYHLYERAEEEGYFKRLILEQSNQCLGPPAQAWLAFERRLPAKSRLSTGDKQKSTSTNNGKGAENVADRSDHDDGYYWSELANDDLNPPIIMTQKVAGLKPATTYRFDLYVSKPSGQQLPYRTIWVKTRSSCDEEEELSMQ